MSFEQWSFLVASDIHESIDIIDVTKDFKIFDVNLVIIHISYTFCCV